MDGVFGNLLNALAEIWKNIGLAQRVSIVLTGIATLGICAFVVYFGTRPDWHILYADMEPKQAAKVYDLVSGAGIQAKLTDSGKTIMVPSKDVYKMRLKVAGEGLQPNAVTSGGWETFDKLPLGATDLQQQLAKQRALQGELEKMINEMPGVASSRVMLTIPQKSVFKKDRVRPSASVMINLQQGSMLGGQEVNGIRCLISSSVSGMTPDDVTISDNKGHLLARQSSEEGDMSGDNSKFMEMQSRTERMLKEKAEAILRPIVGPENVVAMVSCDMDFDNVDKITESYDPDRAVVVSEKSIVEDMNKRSGSEGAGGKVGTAANLTAGETAVDVNDPSKKAEEKISKEQKSVSERTYLVSKTVEKTAIKAGRIKNIAVAVTIAKKAEGGAWTADEKKKFESLVNAAVGAAIYQNNIAAGAANVQATPSVTVEEMDFFKTPKIEYKASTLDSLGEGVNSLSASPLVRPLLGVLLLGVLFLVFKNYFGKSSDAGEVAGVNAVFSEEVRQLPTEAAAERQSELAPIMDALQAKASASPQTVAALMENWLSQDQT